MKAGFIEKIQLSAKTKSYTLPSVCFAVLKILSYWMLVFLTLKLFWILYNYELIGGLSDLFSASVHALYYGFFLDLAMASQMTIVLLILWMFSLLLTPRLQLVVQRVSLVPLLGFIVMISIGEAVVYKHWGSKLNFRALQILETPSELLAIATLLELVCLFLTMVAFFASLYSIAIRWNFHFNVSPQEPIKSRLRLFLISFVLLAPLILAARGGWKLVPINASSAHYSSVPTLNDSATNPTWHFSKSVLTYSLFIGKNNPYISLSPEEKDKALAYYYSGVKPRKTKGILTTEKPNVVFLVLESWSSDIIKKLGGFQDVTPNFDQLASEGVLFTNFYASGNRSQQGMAAIFSGFPALPYVTAAEDTSFTKNMPKLMQHLSQLGYSSHFFYGGQLQFGNIKSLLLYTGFTHLTEEWDLPFSMPRGQMGVRDGPMLELLLNHIDLQQDSHLSAFFSVSTHTPFDVEFDWMPTEGKPTDKKYLISARYADYELGKFFEKAKEKTWYEKTLFVIVADHSYPTSLHRFNSDPNYRRIPLLILGGALQSQLKGTTVDRISSQVDIPATIGSQFGFDQSGLKWSKDLFSEDSDEYAYYDINDGAGMVLPHTSLKLDARTKGCVNEAGEIVSDSKECYFTRAFVQDLIETFINAAHK